MLLSVAAEYRANGGAMSLLTTHRTKLEQMADSLIGLIQSNGLTNTFLVGSGVQFQYTLDAFEVAQGLRQFALLERDGFGDLSKAAIYANAAARVEAGIRQQLLDPGSQLFKAYTDTIIEPAPAPNLDLWYPDVLAQAWPLITDFISGTSSEAAHLVDAISAKWDGTQHRDWTTRSDAGWLAWAALRKGDKSRNESSLQHMLHSALQNGKATPASGSSFDGVAATSTVADFGFLLNALLPATNPDVVVARSDVSTDIDVRANDFSLTTDSADLVVTIVVPPSSGSASIVNGQVRYVPDAGFMGDDSLFYLVQAADGGSRVGQVSVHVAQVPQLSGTVDVSNIEGTTSALFPNVTIGGVDAATFATAEVTLASFVAGEDQLDFVSSPATGNIAIVSNSGGVLRLSSLGATATRTQWQAALRAVTYRTLSDTPSSSPRTVSLRLSNEAFESDPLTTSLSIVPVDDAPTMAVISNQSTDEDVALGVAITVGDVDSSLSSVTVSASSSDTTLVPNGNLVLTGSGASRLLTITPAANRSGTTLITVTANDGTSSFSRSFMLTVNPINDVPSISNVGDQTTDEDVATSAINFAVDDIETSAGTLTVSATSSDPTLVPNGAIAFGGSGANRSVIVTPAANRSGSATITLTVSDGTSTTSDSFVLTVAAVNDAPTVSLIADQSTDEDVATEAIAFVIDDVESLATDLVVSATSSNQTLVPNGNVVLSGAGANRSLRITPTAEQSCTSTITVTISDGGQTASISFTVTVNGINDSPTISDITSQTIHEDDATSLLQFTVGDTETAASNLNVTAALTPTRCTATRATTRSMAVTVTIKCAEHGALTRSTADSATTASLRKPIRTSCSSACS